MANEAAGDKSELKSTGYELFILMLSLISVFNLLVDYESLLAGWLNARISLTIPSANPVSLQVIEIINAILTVFFVIDFTFRITTTSSKSGYFFRNWGWADLLACIPTFRIFRIFRILRASRLMRRFGVRKMLDELINNRAGSALYITMVALIVLVEIAAVFVLKFESVNPDANLTSAGDAVWWVFVTVTTVGYGDFYPTTLGGRTLGVMVMFGGIALIGVLASFLSNFFLAPPKEKPVEAPEGTAIANVGALRLMLKQQEKLTNELEDRLSEIEKELAKKS
ncbi:MAG TPA: ion transporter [Anaerolineales bacterium]|nr:ion transporter [Anaerolineales bacterium]